MRNWEIHRPQYFLVYVDLWGIHAHDIQVTSSLFQIRQVLRAEDFEYMRHLALIHSYTVEGGLTFIAKFHDNVIKLQVIGKKLMKIKIFPDKICFDIIRPQSIIRSWISVKSVTYHQVFLLKIFSRYYSIWNSNEEFKIITYIPYPLGLRYRIQYLSMYYNGLQ